MDVKKNKTSKRRKVDYISTKISDYIEPSEKQILHYVDTILVRHAKNVLQYEQDNHKQQLNKLLKKKKKIIELKEEIEYIRSEKDHVLSSELNTKITNIRKLQDSLRQDIDSEQLFFLTDTYCNDYTSIIANLIDEIRQICSRKHIKINICIEKINNLIKAVHDFSSKISPEIHNLKKCLDKETDTSYKCKKCHNETMFKETLDNNIICKKCGMHVQYLGTKDMFYNINDFYHFLGKLDVPNREYHNNNNNKHLVDKPDSSNTYISSEKVYIKNRYLNKLRKKGISNEELREVKKQLKKKKIIFNNKNNNNLVKNNASNNNNHRRSATYKRLNHFREIVKQASGLTSSRISQEMKEEFQLLMKLHNIKPENLTPQICRKLQSFMKHNIKNYQTNVSLCRLFNPTYKTLVLNREQNLLLEMRFIQLEQVFDAACKKVCPNRKNFPSYPQILYRLLQDLNIADDIILSSTNFLKSNKLLHNADILHLEMCQMLNWTKSINRGTIPFY